MQPAPSSQPGYIGGATGRGRAAAALLALAITSLLVLLLIRLGILSELPTEVAKGPVTLKLLPGLNAESSRAPAKPTARRSERSERETERPRTTIPPPLVRVKTPVPALNLMPISKTDLATLDTAMTTPHARRDATELADAGGSGDAGDGSSAAGGGGGPGGERLYNADWYRRPPSHAELATYMARTTAPTGWGEIACRTIPDYRVEDCRELDETPGSGFARALREAAWQFRVQPPRRGGKTLVGAWVRIHVDFSSSFAG